MKNMMNFVDSLIQQVRGDVLFDDFSLGMYSTDASIYQIKPIVVVLPRDQEDVKKAVSLAVGHNISILPRGAGTSLAGQAVGSSMILDFSKYMNSILEINREEKWVRVQPGIARDDLNAVLSEYGLQFAPDPATSSRANVGGMVGNNSSGTKSILYGKTVDHLLESEVLLANGTELHFKELTETEYQLKSGQNDYEGTIYKQFHSVIRANDSEIKKRFPKVMRRVGGYNLDEFVYTTNWNLSKLICGSEGTLAILLSLKLNLVELPKSKSVVVVHFSAIPEAISAVRKILPYGPSAVEILDDTVIKMSRENLTTRHHCHFIEGQPSAILIVEFYGESPEEVKGKAENMVSHLQKIGLGYAYPLFPEGNDFNDVWIIRKKGLGLMLGIKGNKKPLPFIEDAGIPAEYLPEYIDQVLKICAKHETKAAMYAHASVGVIHVRPILDLRLAEDIERMKRITEDTFNLVVKYGGSWSGEHGDGLVRSAFNQRFFGEQLYQSFIAIKRLFDPKNLMNPGKIVEAQAMDQNLRYGIECRDMNIQSQYQFREEGGFQAAVHMCTGVGECRKMIGGTMCPSFKATRDEEHSTRGRANTLRLAMSNQMGLTALSNQRLYEVMELCLSCKACKSECPSNVDMAKMKSEILQIYYDNHGLTFRDKLIRDSVKAAKLISGWRAGAVNAFLKTSLIRILMDRIGKFDKRRTLPTYAKQPFYQWYHSNHHATESGKKVVLFADTYLNYHEPQVGIAAYKLLKSCGYEVILANIGCCQRPKISHGFLKEAKKEGTKMLEKLKFFLDQGLKVVVCEPGCASALIDDMPDLIQDRKLADQLKSGVMMIDAFLTKERAKNQVISQISSYSKEIAIHGHCHQKALFGIQTMKSLIPESTGVTEIASGCCGMAGSFGYEKEHYDISRRIGEDRLFPYLRKLNREVEVVACGFSCRHQIEHFTGIKAKHFVEVIKVD